MLNSNLRIEYKNYTIQANNGTPTSTEVNMEYQGEVIKVQNQSFNYKICCRTIGTSGDAYAEYSVYNSKVSTVFSVGNSLSVFPSLRIDSYGSIKLYLPNTTGKYVVATSVEQLGA